MIWMPAHEYGDDDSGGSYRFLFLNGQTYLLTFDYWDDPDHFDDGAGVVVLMQADLTLNPPNWRTIFKTDHVDFEVAEREYDRVVDSVETIIMEASL